jgi:hypothetical protein
MRNVIKTVHNKYSNQEGLTKSDLLRYIIF